ncbi:unnamed protein product [Bathycoccus prasinos]
MTLSASSSSNPSSMTSALADAHLMDSSSVNKSHIIDFVDVDGEEEEAVDETYLRSNADADVVTN